MLSDIYLATRIPPFYYGHTSLTNINIKDGSILLCQGELSQSVSYLPRKQQSLCSHSDPSLIVIASFTSVCWFIQYFRILKYQIYPPLSSGNEQTWLVWPTKIVHGLNWLIFSSTIIASWLCECITPQVSYSVLPRICAKPCCKAVKYLDNYMYYHSFLGMVKDFILPEPIGSNCLQGFEVKIDSIFFCSAKNRKITANVGIPAHNAG